MQNKNTVPLLIVLLAIIVAVVVIIVVKKNNTAAIPNEPATSTPTTTVPYTYKNHGITLNLPGYTPTEQKAEGGPAYTITLPEGILTYVTDAGWWESNVHPDYTYVRAEAIGSTVYKVYTYSGKTFYWFKQGNVGYEYSGNTDSIKSLKFVGWAQ